MYGLDGMQSTVHFFLSRMPCERKVARRKEHRTEADDVTTASITAVQGVRDDKHGSKSRGRRSHLLAPPTTLAHGSIPFSSSPQSKRRSRTNKMPSQVSPTSDVILYFLAIFIPPIPVFMKRACGADLLINILLWILGWIPGVLHAWYIISKSEGAM